MGKNQGSSQGSYARGDKTIYQAVSETSTELVELPEILRELEAQMADPDIASDPDEMSRVLEEYGKVQERFEARVAIPLGIVLRPS